MATQVVIRNGSVTEVLAPAAASPKVRFMTIRDLPHQRDEISSYQNGNSLLIQRLHRSTEALNRTSEQMDKMNAEVEKMVADLEEVQTVRENEITQANQALEGAKEIQEKIEDLSRKAEAVPPDPVPFYVLAFEWVRKKLQS